MPYEGSQYNFTYSLDLFDALSNPSIPDEEDYMKGRPLPKPADVQRASFATLDALASGCEVQVLQAKGRVRLFVSDTDENSSFGAKLRAPSLDVHGMSNIFGGPVRFKYFYGVGRDSEKRASYGK